MNLLKNPFIYYPGLAIALNMVNLKGFKFFFLKF